MLGTEYLLDLVKKQLHDNAYKVYVTDALKVIAENTARYVGGKTIKLRYSDIFEPKKVEIKRSPEEIKRNILDEYAKIGGA